MRFEEWIRIEEGYPYYQQPRFSRMFAEVEIVSQGIGKSAIILYKGYAVGAWMCRKKSIVLIDYVFNVDEKRAVIQRKLHHEYENCFELFSIASKNKSDTYEEGYVITQYNMWHVVDYLVSVFAKIDNGFDRYSELLAKQDLETNNVGFLKIEINNAFSIEELNKLLDAYNQLYALLYCACINGCESITEVSMKEMQDRPNLIVESIHIGSYGLLMSVGEALIVDLLKEAILAAFRGADSIAVERRREIESKAEVDRKFQDNEKIRRLIDQLDSVLDRRAAGGNPVTDYYLHNQMLKLMNEIEELQGTRHIDIAI